MIKSKKLNLHRQEYKLSSKKCILVLFLFISIFLVSLKFVKVKTIEIKTDLSNLVLTNYKKSIDGIFLLGIANNEFDKPFTSELLAFNSNGKILFDRPLYNGGVSMAAFDFVELTNGHYSYFLSHLNHFNSLHFLNNQFKDLFVPISNQNDPDLDNHDIINTKDGNYFLIFNHKKTLEPIFNTEIKEINSKGETIFTWKVFDHISPNDYLNTDYIDPIHLNSISLGERSDIYISLSGIGEILKIQYPSGKLLSRITSKDWKFINDPYNGFIRQHSINYLGNNRILMFDNGSEKRNISRAVEYELDEQNKIATLKWSFDAYFPDKYSRSGGSVMRLKNGNTLIGWGIPLEGSKHVGNEYILFTEVSTDGKIVRELSSKNYATSYRVYFKDQSSIK